MIFLAVFMSAYYMLRGNIRLRNLLIVAASYVFYGWWDYRFLSLILISTLLDYFAGLGIEQAATPGGRKGWLMASLAGNLLILGFFKYCNFFADSL
ncbi:MAG: MBOAT family protein, partial [Lentisphaerota bacterium]